MDPNDVSSTGSTETRTFERRFIGRYEVRRLLGSGGMGQVYLAHDPVLDREIAVKLIGDELDDEHARHRLVQEARAAGRLRHPNIVTIFDAGEHEGSPYIAMEHVAGETLRNLIRRRAPLSLSHRLGLAGAACAGLAHAHRANVVHLDVKPDNLMLDGNGVLKVLDFGIARVLKSDVLVTVHVAGTLRYMSPEQVTGGPLDRRSDVFSLGCSLFELVAYEPAYTGSAGELVSRIARGPVPRLAEAVSSVDARLDALVARAMSLDPAERFDDLDELGTALADLSKEFDSQPPRVSTTVPPPPTNRTRQRRRTVAGLGAASTLALGSAAVWMLTQTPPEGTGPSAPLTTPTPTAPIQTGPTTAPSRPSEAVAAEGPQGGVVPRPSGTTTPRPIPSVQPKAPALASASREDVWRRLAGGDRSGVLELLRQIAREDADPRIANEVVDAVRPAVMQARADAAASPALRGSPDYRIAEENLARANQLAQSRQPIDALGAFWQAMDSFTKAAAGAKAGPLPAPVAPAVAAPDAIPPPRAETADLRPVTAPPETSNPATAAAVESESVLAALHRYHQGYTALDAAAVRQMYPTLGPDRLEQLRRSFEAVTAYDIDLRQPRVDVMGNAAVVHAVVVRRIVPRVGRPVTSEVNTEFRLQRDARGWVIVEVKAN